MSVAWLYIYTMLQLGADVVQHWSGTAPSHCPLPLLLQDFRKFCGSLASIVLTHQCSIFSVFVSSCLSLQTIPSSYNASHVGLRTTLTSSFNYCKGLMSTQEHSLRIRTSIDAFGGHSSAQGRPCWERSSDGRRSPCSRRPSRKYWARAASLNSRPRPGLADSESLPLLPWKRIYCNCFCNDFFFSQKTDFFFFWTFSTYSGYDFGNVAHYQMYLLE